MSRPKQIVAHGQISIPEEEYEEQLPPSKCAKILYYTWKFCSCIFSHFIMITLVIAYCILGAFTFSKLESENEKQVKESIIKIRKNITEAIWTITEESLVLHEDNWTSSVKETLKLFEGDILTAMKRRGWDGHDNVIVQQWTFTGALFYSIIVITTIGYGHIAPKTQMGKVVTIFYAILGIPLMLLCLSNIGDVMASSFRFIYWRVCCYMCTRKPKKKHRQKSLSRQGSRSVRGRTQSVRRRARAASLPRAHSDTDCRYKDDSYVSPTASRGAGRARGRNIDRGPLRSQSHTPGAHLEVPNLGNRDARRSPSNRSPARLNAYGDKVGDKASRSAIPLHDINDDIYGLNPPRRGRARPGDLRSRSLPRPQREELNPAGKRFFSDRSYPKPNPRNHEYYPRRQSDYDSRDNDVFGSRNDRIDEGKLNENVGKRDMFDRYGTGGRARRFDRIVSMDPEYYDYDREDDDMVYDRNRGRRATSQNDYRETEYDDEDFEPIRRYGRYPKDDFRHYYDHSPDRIPGLDDYDMGQWRSRGPPRRDDPLDDEWLPDNRLPRTERLPRFDRPTRSDDRLPRSGRFPRLDREDEDFEEGMPHVVDCWSEDEDIVEFLPPNAVRRPPPAIKATASPRMMTPMGLRVSRQAPARSEESPHLPTTAGAMSHNGTIADYPTTYNKEQIKPVPIWLCVFLVISYIIAGAFLFQNWEAWSFLDSAYFCFITLTTIGFGDFVPAQGVESNSELRIALCSLYLLFGISLLAMSFNLVQEEVIANIKSVAKKLGIIKPEYGEESDDD